MESLKVSDINTSFSGEVQVPVDDTIMVLYDDGKVQS